MEKNYKPIYSEFSFREIIDMLHGIFNLPKEIPNRENNLSILSYELSLRPFEDRHSYYNEVCTHITNNYSEEKFERASKLEEFKQFYYNRVLQ